MKRSNSSAATNRRALIRHHQPLLNDPEVAAFLDGGPARIFGGLGEKLIQANEPALLLEYIAVSQCSMFNLQWLNDRYETMALPEGLLEYLLEHIERASGLTMLAVQGAALSTACCTLMQNALTSPACALTALTFEDCHFVDPHVQFPLRAPTIRTLHWHENTRLPGAVSPMDQMLSALAGWDHLESTSLIMREGLLNFATITQMLTHNPKVTHLHLMCDTAPAAPGDAAYQPQHDPALLFNLLENNQIPLVKLEIYVRDARNQAFNRHFLQHMSQCLMTNTTLESLYAPGIGMSTQADLAQFNTSLNANHSLLYLAPLEPFNDKVPPPLRRNDRQRHWFTQDFVLGAAEAFVRLIELPSELGPKVGNHLASTPLERIYCGALMALVCKSTHQGAVKLRSTGLREALLLYIRTNDGDRCLGLLHALVRNNVDLLPEDKRVVVEYANSRGRQDFLPHGYGL